MASELEVRLVDLEGQSPYLRVEDTFGVTMVHERAWAALLDALLRERGYLAKRASTESMVVHGPETSIWRVAYSIEWTDGASPMLVPSPTIYVPVQREEPE